MRIMIQILILAVILTPAATFAGPHGEKKGRPERPVRGTQVTKPQPVRRPGPGPVRRPDPSPVRRPGPGPKPGPKPGPGPKPTPTHNPPHRKDHDHDRHHGHHGDHDRHGHNQHHQSQTRVIYVPGSGYWGRGTVVQQNTYTTPTQLQTPSQPVLSTQAPSTQVLSTRDFLLSRDLYRGQRVAICGRVTEVARSLAGVNYVILDGAVWCEFPRDFRGGNAQAATDQYVTIVGVATGGRNATASADLVECARPF